MNRSKTRRGVPEITHAYAAAVSACAKSAQKDAALALLPRMRRNGHAPGLEAYNAAILACHVDGGDADAEHDLMRAIRGDRLRPDTWTYNAVLKVCCCALRMLITTAPKLLITTTAPNYSSHRFLHSA